jgi:UDP-N-acetylglucosamine diphosphorylase/glucosamine-1-phosphate N-acetyltransferase
MFQWNKELIEFDFSLVTKGRISSDTNETVIVRKVSQVFIEENASLDHCILNASTGPIYIGKNATIMEGCTIRGPFSLGEGAVLKMGTRVYGATTIGPYCMGGGEIKNSILSGYSNKAHDGYLGDSVIGEWCNMGAGTSNSNLKNTGGIVNLWSYAAKNYLPAGNKCGVVMGDYSRTAINSSLNTGSVIGVCSNVFGTGLLPKFIPDFTWGSLPTEKYKFDNAIKDIDNWKKMKNKTISAGETQVLKHIFELSVNN